MRLILKWRALWLVAAFTSFTGAVQAEERIVSFHSVLRINQNATMEVEETISVIAEGVAIKRGIYRDFPTRYQDRFGHVVNVGFNVTDVTRDGASEDYHIEKRDNGYRVYIGSSSRFIESGRYNYVLSYTTNRQLGFFEDHDELYWNVNGNGWDFRAEKVSAEVHLPAPVSPERLNLTAYTGYSGSVSADYTSSKTRGSAKFRTTRGLAAGEGLTIVVEFPKGIVNRPGTIDRLVYFALDNRSTAWMTAALLLSILYLSLVWLRVGKDPTPGVIYPRYEPPKDYSPDSARYISRMGYDDRVFSASLLNLAAHGYIRISEEGDVFVLHKLTPSEPCIPLSTGEQEVLKHVFRGISSVEMKNEHHEALQAARSAHEEALKRVYLGKYFRKNGPYLLPSFGFSLLCLCFAIMAPSFSFWAILASILNLGTHFLFLRLMKQPTTKGRTLLDALDGFRLYLSVAEGDELKRASPKSATPPEKTPELYEAYLPFAVALGVENDWEEQFREVFSRLGQGDDSPRVSWYSGESYFRGGFGSDMVKSFDTAISSASRPPGSSSGGSSSSSGGGGFSGGGGGGGGGGGW